MARRPPKTSDDVRDYFVTHDLALIGDAAFVMQSAVADGSAPITHALAPQSDLGFIDDLTSQAISAGLERALAESLVASVLASPSLALRRSRNGNGEFLQAKIFQRDDSRGDALSQSDIAVAVFATIAPRAEARGGPRTPPAVTFSQVDVAMVDASSTADLGEIGHQAMGWFRDYPAPPAPRRSRHPEFAVIGDPGVRGSVDVPDAWRDDVRALARVYGLDLKLELRSGRERLELSDNTVHAFVLDAAFAGRVPEGITSTALDSRQMSWRKMLSEMAGKLALATEEEELPVTSRELASGERVFHRKIGNSRHFDRFDSGSPDPCKHQVGSFVPWGGPKATKGMARRYSNFHPSMLRHCGKYPNCNVYAVFAPQA